MRFFSKDIVKLLLVNNIINFGGWKMVCTTHKLVKNTFNSLQENDLFIIPRWEYISHKQYTD